jgi:hypothetical protein
MKFIKAVAAVFFGSTSLVSGQNIIGQNIIEVAQSAGFNTLLTAIGAAGLTGVFDRTGPDYSK